MTKITRGIDHIGVTVPDIEKATIFFKKLLELKLLMIMKKQKMNL
ncbi:hypothetical protein AAAC51_37215 [Priestia megaterium]